ncbi:nuclear pore complex Nup205-like, partial [Paramuricea clavata]
IMLCNFIRVAGDLLPSTLFVPYLGMLTGLACSERSAHHCFNLLKTNGLNATGAANAVSWDHFFDSLKRYYVDLRHDNTGMLSGNYQAQFSPMNITADEQVGLEAVLRLTATVADKDEVARIAICENPAWVPLTSMFGLLGCSIPTSLKGFCLISDEVSCSATENTSEDLQTSLEDVPVVRVSQSELSNLAETSQDSRSTPPPSLDPSSPSSPLSPTSKLLDAWNPMSHDYQAFRNAYNVQTDNLDVAITGY